MFAGLSLVLLINVALVVHVIKAGRNMLWIWALLLLPPLGAIAYVLVELLPGLYAAPDTQRSLRSLRQVVDPNRDLREASVNASVADTVATKARLGTEQSRRGDHAAAIATFKSGLRGLYEYDPTLLQGLAEAQFAASDFASARDSLEALARHNPEYRAPTAKLLYARALEAVGELARAEVEYRAAADIFPGAEAKTRHALLLKRVGKAAEARELLQELVKSAEVAPRHVRRSQGEWFALARRALAD